MNETIAIRIGKLLAKAEHTTPEEAEAAIAKAQQLASTHSIDLAVARHLHSGPAVEGEAEDVIEDRFVILGDPRTAGLRQKHRMFSALAEAHSVRFLTANDRTTVYPVGYASDLDIIEQMFHALSEQMVQAGNQWVKGREWASDTYTKWEEVTVTREGCLPYRTMAEVERPVTARMARDSFYSGFAYRVERRITMAERQARQDAEQQHGSTEQGLSVTTLALRDKETRINEFFDQYARTMGVNPTKRSYRRASSDRAFHAGSSHAGHVAGGEATFSTRKALA